MLCHVLQTFRDQQLTDSKPIMTKTKRRYRISCNNSPRLVLENGLLLKEIRYSDRR